MSEPTDLEKDLEYIQEGNAKAWETFARLYEQWQLEADREICRAVFGEEDDRTRT